jgi:replicative DNA helicase
MTDLRDPVAEAQLLAIALSADSLPEEFIALPLSAFDGWQHQAIAAALRDLHARGLPTDVEVVMRMVVERAGTDSRAQQMGTVVAKLATHHVPAASAGYYADRLGGLAAARSVSAAAQHFAQAVEHAAENDDEQGLSHAVKTMRGAVDDAERTFRPVAQEPPMSLADLLNSEEDAYDWLVPGLFERMDRLIITGFEGLGKSFLLAQFALCIAAGIHPFSRDGLPREHRVLVFDVENSKRQLRRRYRGIRYQVDALREAKHWAPVDWSEQMRIVSRPEGVALTDPRELARIEQAISATAPDLVVCGPLYKMSTLDIRDEQAAKELCDTLDGLRVRHQFTLIAEAHAGHSSDGGGNRRVRPIGSSVFLRWPEFGFGLAPFGDAAHQEHPDTVEVKHWRGARDERKWPRLLKHGTSLPWEPGNSDYWDMPNGDQR